MNAYEKKQQARKELFEELAAKAMAESEATAEKAYRMSSAIPMGQPIHGESDRKFRERIGDTMSKAVDLQDKAKYYEEKAASVGTGGISGRDPEAVSKLEAELEKLKESHEIMKAVNAAVRKHSTYDERLRSIMALGTVNEAMAIELLKPDSIGRVGFPSFSISNTNANIARVTARIATLKAINSRKPVERKGDGYMYVEDVEESRIMFIFEGNPAVKIRDILKRHAFKWAPSKGAWVRQLTANGLFAAKHVEKELSGI